MLERAGRIIRRILLGMALVVALLVFLIAYMGSNTGTRPAPSATTSSRGILPPPSERMTKEEFEAASARDKALRDQEQTTRHTAQIADYMEEIQVSSELLDLAKAQPINTGWLTLVSVFDEGAKAYSNRAALELTAEQEATRLRLGTKLQQMQVAMFPKIRAAMADELGKRLWRQDYKVMAYDCHGNRRNQCFSVSGFRLSLNRAKQEMHESLRSQLAQVRFTAAYYRAFSGDDGESGWTLTDIPADGDIAYRGFGAYVVALKAQQRTGR